MMRYVLKNDSKVQRTYHVVNVISALNEKLNCFSNHGDSMSTHIKNLIEFLSTVVGSGCNAAPCDVFYARSIHDIAFAYSTYMRLTSEEYVAIAYKLENVLNEARANGNGITRRRNYSTISVNNEVVVNIFDNKFKGAKPDELAKLGEEALEDLKDCIRRNPEYFSAHRNYSTIREMMKWYNDEKDIILDGEYRYVRNSCRVDLFLDNHSLSEKPLSREEISALKDREVEYLYGDLRLAVGYPHSQSIIAVEYDKKEKKKVINKKPFSMEKIFGLNHQDPIETSCAGVITLLRYSIIVDVANHYINDAAKCPPNAATLSGPAMAIEMINEIMAEFGLVRLHGIHRKSSYLDWCLYKYITDEEVRKNADGYLESVRNGANPELQ